MDRRTWTFIVVGLLVALVFAVGVSQLASPDPDGLEYVAEQEGFLETAEDHALGDAPLADYGANLGGTDRVNTAVAGAVGVVHHPRRRLGPVPAGGAGQRRTSLDSGSREGMTGVGGHTHALFRHGDSPLHRLPAHVKVVAALVLVFAVVATPREAIWLFAAYLGVLVAAAALAGLGLRFVLSRLVIEVPFLLAAVALPFLGAGEQVEVLGLSLSVEGLWGLWNITAKATLGLLVSIVLAGTTEVPDLLSGLDRLHLPRVMTAIMGFMVRYADVVAAEFARMRVAMRVPRRRDDLAGAIRPFAHGLGGLFVRSYERGERVYLAMASRGFTGSMPATTSIPAPAATWAAALAVPVVAWVAVGAAWLGR